MACVGLIKYQNRLLKTLNVDMTTVDTLSVFVRSIGLQVLLPIQTHKISKYHYKQTIC